MERAYLDFKGTPAPGETTTLDVNQTIRVPYTAKRGETTKSLLLQFAERVQSALYRLGNYSSGIDPDGRLQLLAHGPQFHPSIEVITTDEALKPVVTAN